MFFCVLSLLTFSHVLSTLQECYESFMIINKLYIYSCIKLRIFHYELNVINKSLAHKQTK